MSHSSPAPSRESPSGPDDDWARRVTGGIAGGSREALASLYERRFDFLYRVARDTTRLDESFALDCVQDAMLRVARCLPRLEGVAALDAWLRRAILSAAVDRVRSERARARRERRVAGGEPTEPLDRAHDALQAALVDLDADERDLLRLRFERGLTLVELARHLHLAPKAIDSRIRRLLARLRSRATAADSDVAGDRSP